MDADRFAVQEDELDIRRYLRLLVGNWRLIVGISGGLAILAFVVSLVLPPTYRATSLVAILSSRYQFQFSEDIANLPEQDLPSNAIIEFAMADDLLSEVLEGLGGIGPSGTTTLEDLREELDARTGQDPSVVRLVVNARHADVAVKTSNLWADLLVDYVNNLYEPRSTDRDFFAVQVEDAFDKLQKADQALVEFQSSNRLKVVQSELESRVNLLNTYEARRNDLLLIQQSLETFREQVEGGSEEETSDLGDELAALGLQMRTLDAQGSTQVEMQFAPGISTSTSTIEDLIARIEKLQGIAQDQISRTEVEIAGLPEDILSLQTELQSLEIEEERLTTDRQLANESYISLSKKLAETEISSQGGSRSATIASYASVPTEPAQPKKLRNTVVGGVAGLVLSVLIILAKDMLAEEAPAEG